MADTGQTCTVHSRTGSRGTLTRGNEKQRAEDCEQTLPGPSQGSQSSSPPGVGTLGGPSPRGGEFTAAKWSASSGRTSLEPAGCLGADGILAGRSHSSGRRSSVGRGSLKATQGSPQGNPMSCHGAQVWGAAERDPVPLRHVSVVHDCSS